MQTFCEITTDGMLDYLLAIYYLGQRNKPAPNKVTTTLLAEKMHVSTAAASSMLKRLKECGFVERSGTEGVILRKQGYLAAMQLLRRHRLLEVFLMQTMGFSWDQVDVEAHRLEHAISNAFVDRMDQLCGYPTHCPHGDPIPTKEGHLPEETLFPITELPPSQSGFLWRIATDDARILRYLGQRNLTPGKRVTLVECEPFNGPVTIQVEIDGDETESPSAEQSLSSDETTGKVQILGAELAALLYITLEKEPDDMRSGWDYQAIDTQ
ncbi:MAG: metal-dependent transcriptional regulator [Chloroflexota bacterium]